MYVLLLHFCIDIIIGIQSYSIWQRITELVLSVKTKMIIHRMIIPNTKKKYFQMDKTNAVLIPNSTSILNHEYIKQNSHLSER